MPPFCLFGFTCRGQVKRWECSQAKAYPPDSDLLIADGDETVISLSMPNWLIRGLHAAALSEIPFDASLVAGRPKNDESASFTIAAELALISAISLGERTQEGLAFD
jgi:hypothetical protein